MLELVFVYYLCKGLGKRARAKGYRPVWLQALLVLLWIGGEIGGAVVATIVALIVSPPADMATFEPPMLPLYLGALCGAGIGAGMAFAIVALLPDKSSETEEGSGGSAKCPGCGEPVASHSDRCPLCGQVLSPSGAT
jgi:hypothetical protein